MGRFSRPCGLKCGMGYKPGVEGVPPSDRGQDARDTGSGREKSWQL
ncbi:MAG: hypothetical protein ACYSUX_17775 [Planctomycetota bacterium]